MEFALEEFMRNGVECLFEIKDEDVCLLAIVNRRCPVVNYIDELRLATVSLSEGVLPVVKNVVVVKVRHQVGANYVLQHFAQDACEGYWPIIARQGPVILFEEGAYISIFPVFWNSSGIYGLLKKMR